MCKGIPALNQYLVSKKVMLKKQKIFRVTRHLPQKKLFEIEKTHITKSGDVEVEMEDEASCQEDIEK